MVSLLATVAASANSFTEEFANQYKLQLVHSNKCLQLATDGKWQKYQNAHQYECDGASKEEGIKVSQNFKFNSVTNTTNKTEYVQIKNLESDMCLTAQPKAFRHVIISPCNPFDAKQQFEPIRTATTDIVQFKLKNTFLCIDILLAEKADSNILITFACRPDATNSQFKLLPAKK